MRFDTRRHKKGSTLATILLLTSVVAILAFALAGSSVAHLHLSYRATNSESAENLAESVIAYTLEKVVEDHTFGKSRLSSETIQLPELNETKTAALTFHEETAENQGLLYSTNNLESDAAVSGSTGRVLPAHSLHLVGQGSRNGVPRKVEALFHVPKFPYVVATAGTFTTEGETLVASVDRMDALQGPSDDWELEPGHVSSNSADPEALTFSSSTKVTGDAKASGGVLLQSGATVLGQVKPHSETTEIPRYSVTDFDPELTGKTGITRIATGNVRRANYEGWVKRDGDLLVTDGLHLDNGVLYVDGNLSVEGGVTGTGALLVTGDTFVTGRSALTSDNLAAIVGEGNISLQGDSSGSSIFRGLIYSNKDLVAEDMTIVGTLLVAGDGGSLNLRDTRVVYSPDSISIDLQHRARTGLQFVSPSGANPGAYLGTKKTDRSVNSKQTIYVELTPDGKFKLYPSTGDDDNGIVVDDPEQARQAIKSLLALEESGKTLQAFDSSTQTRLINLLSNVQSGTEQLEEEAVDLVTIDPSKLLSLADKMRLVLIREI